MSLVAAIKRANRPQPPETSVRVRVAVGVAVVIAVSACHAQSEVATRTWLVAMALLTIGMMFSHRTRNRPPGWIKPILAVAAIAALVWFVGQITGRATAGITNIADPLTALFVLVQVVHSFHVPARKDLVLSLASSTVLMALAGAQAVDLHFAWYAVPWAAAGLGGLTEMWSSTSRGGRISPRGLAGTLGATAAVGVAVFLVLPAPRATVQVNFLARAGTGGAIGLPGGLAGDSGTPAQPAKAGTLAGPTRVGGYLGFADRLDTALRGRLSNTVVMRVRADRPSFWVGETFDIWTGKEWYASINTVNTDLEVGGSSPLLVPLAAGDVAGGRSDLQTFFVVQSTPDLVFHAESARRVWFPAPSLFISVDGTLVSPIGLGRGAVYTVESEVTSPSEAELRGPAGPGVGALPDDVLARETFLPYEHPQDGYPQAQALAESVTANDHTTYDKVQSLIAWISANTRYSVDIPPLPPGKDTVNDFLFGSRVGFCEQISTSLAVMLRTLGIPARETVGYIPGPYNPITGLYDVRAKDAHAWVQVWFPGYGWQNFDPTADVPTTNPTPGAVALNDIGHALGRIPPVPASAVLSVAALVASAVRYRRRRPATWAARVARQIERSGARSGRRRQPAETLAEYAAVLETRAGSSGDSSWLAVARQVEQSAYGGRELSATAGRQSIAALRQFQRRSAQDSGWPSRHSPSR